MNLYCLNDLMENMPEFRKICSLLLNNSKSKTVISLPGTAYSIFTASIYDVIRSPVLFVSAHPESAKRSYEQMKLWVAAENCIRYFPEVDLLSSTMSIDPQVNSERLRILSQLLDWHPGSRDSQVTPFVVASALSLANRSITSNDLISGRLDVYKGLEIKQPVLLEKLQSIGYEYDQVVEVPGTFVKRGGIVDIFPADREQPVRVEFLGDEVESIREYDSRTQRSLSHLPSVIIYPAKELAAAGNANLLDYLPHNAILILDDSTQIQAEVERIEEQSAGLKTKDEYEVNSAEQLTYFGWKEIADKLVRLDHIVELNEWSADAALAGAEMRMPIEAAPNYAVRFTALMDNLPDLRADNNRVLIASMQADRVRELLLEHGLDVYPIKSLEEVPPEGALTLLQGSVNGGWRIEGEMLFLTDLELFGIIKQRSSVKPRPVRHHWFLNDIGIGDLVVHVEHGIGRFAGVTRKVSAGVEREYLILEYAGQDTLYVPVEQVDRVSLYIGGGERTPALSRLGSQEWNRSRQKVKESVVNIAGELIELYAGREVGCGVAFSPDTLWQKELEASFPYAETIDQLAAVDAVKSDMESSRPMDRLVCGDVGYGKTEIAIRAAFKAVMNGKQVAVLVPTTILAQQHMDTFKYRLKAFPIQVEMLSRFCSHKEQTEVIGRLGEGTVDICIGTHRLLQKDVVFKDLGLAIIDEEQRFGVVHKEYFKKMRKTVDVLTLSATPIPRTMHMALSGIRDLSTIETPPENRLPIMTYMGEFQNRMVREAVLREMERDGQVFIVHNRVHSIDSLADKIGDLIPEAKIAVAHGQMNEEKLEKVMADFVAGISNVLVTTTIIESGLDMPNVNTIVVDNADKLGLTQLYQLRGRVGRGANVAYAYFLFNSGKSLTDQARERLKTIARATELGAGFAIAMKDLEIRGAGNLLGVEQSGNIAAVGFNYYCQMLAEAVEELKAKRAGQSANQRNEVPPISIDLKIPVFIPEWYIGDTRTRFNIYQRLAKTREMEGVNIISDEIHDRFGEPPDECANLLYMVELRCLALRAEVESVFRNDDQIMISVSEHAAIPERFTAVVRGRGIKVGNRQIHIDIKAFSDQWKERLKWLLDELVKSRSE
ncbi:MAG: transcription-repair coupling factor [Dehalococcoidia bacterium]|nr:transcription-repair coupling factor [Dehalococcoidia bacterium]